MISAKPVDTDQLITIAEIGGTDSKTREIVEDTLNRIDVPSFIEGSVVYAVQVYRRDNKRALEALQAEPRLTGRWIIYKNNLEKSKKSQSP